MLLVAVILLLALVAGWLAGGDVRNLAAIRLTATWLVFVAVGAQAPLAGLVALGAPGPALSRPLLGLSHLALIAFIAVNRHAPGMLLILVGFGLNAAVIVANGAMPVSPEALASLGGDPGFAAGKHMLLDEATALPWLADIIAVPGLRMVVSVGDIVLAVGVGVLVVAQMRRFPPQPGRRRRPRPFPPLSWRARVGAPRPEPLRSAPR
jgi:hypothetical protein